jgi:hypothetical protein
MLTLHPHERTETAKQVIRLSQVMQSGWPKFLLGWAAGFQVVVAVTLAAAPWHQLLTPGTRPVFEIASRYVWAVLYLASACLTASTYWSRAALRTASWMAVMGLGGVWLTAFSLNVWSGGGSALGVVAWLFLYIPIAAVALHQGLTKR